MMDVRNHDAIPGETGRSASFEGRDVVYEVDNDHFHDLRREPTLLMRVRVDICIPASEHALELGFGTAPNEFGEALDIYGGLITNRDSGRDAGYLITKA